MKSTLGAVVPVRRSLGVGATAGLQGEGWGRPEGGAWLSLMSSHATQGATLASRRCGREGWLLQAAGRASCLVPAAAASCPCLLQLSHSPEKLRVPSRGVLGHITSSPHPRSDMRSWPTHLGTLIAL